MKILILIFIICVHYSTSQYPVTLKKLDNPYSKKLRHGMIQYNNAGKYIMLITQTTKTKKPNNLQEYTAFPKPFPTSLVNIDTVHHQIIPDSPYFPVDEPDQPERRSRVKIVLSEYPMLVRHKRAADDKVELKEKETTDLASPVTIITNQSKTKQSDIKPASSVSHSDNIEGATKKLKAPVKKGDGNAPTRKLKSKKRGQLSRSGKNKVYKTPLKSGTINPKSKDHRHERISKHRNQRVGRSKKVKSQKKLLKSGRVPKNLKSGHRGVSKLRNKHAKRHGQRNSNSKVKGVNKPEGHSARRLISASDATIEEYPYTISIQKDGQHWCSGAILNPRLIISTANCFWKSTSISRMRVRAGSRHTNHGGQTAKIQEVMKHPGWKLRKNPDNDIALAMLDRNIRFSHSLHGVDLPNQAMMPPFDDVWVTSWGAERRDGIFDDRSASLQVYRARLLDKDKCNKVTTRFAVQVSENFICLSQSGTRAPCTRDTGAPAVSDGVLWGLASWGIRKLCGTERFPAMFSYTASPSNMNFIINATHLLMAEERNDPFLDRYPVKKYSYTMSTTLTLPWR